MWLSPTTLPPPETEPVDLATARAQCSIDQDDATHDVILNRYIRAARAHCEKYCGAFFAARTVTLTCDRFEDFARLPFAPTTDIDAISYTAADGTPAVLDPSVYRLDQQDEGLEPAIVLRPGQSWPLIAKGSDIEVQAGVGGDPAEDVYLAMLLFIGESFLLRENERRHDWTHLDALLCNNRRGV